VIVWLVSNAGSSSPTTAANASAGTSGAATVERRNLTETDTESGTLSYSKPQTVYNRLNGTITWLPTVGQEIRPGGTLYKIDGEPVTLMSGTTPAYRTLGPATSDGHDVLQLNRNLVALGFNADGIQVNDTWQTATTDGVELFQESLGETPTGTLTLGQVVFLPGPQLISTVDGTLGSNGGGGGSSNPGSSSSSNASTVVTPSHPEFVSLTTPTSGSCSNTGTTTTTSSTETTTSSSSSETTPTTTTPCKTRPTTTNTQPANKGGPSNKQLAALIALLKAEVAQLKSPGPRVRGSTRLGLVAPEPQQQ
jgi:hypothetical protein